MPFVLNTVHRFTQKETFSLDIADKRNKSHWDNCTIGVWYYPSIHFLASGDVFPFLLLDITFFHFKTTGSKEVLKKTIMSYALPQKCVDNKLFLHLIFKDVKVLGDEFIRETPWFSCEILYTLTGGFVISMSWTWMLFLGCQWHLMLSISHAVSSKMITSMNIPLLLLIESRRGHSLLWRYLKKCQAKILLTFNRIKSAWKTHLIQHLFIIFYTHL